MNTTAAANETICEQFAHTVVCGDLLHTLALVALVSLASLLLATAAIFYLCWGRARSNWRLVYYRDLKRRDKEKAVAEKTRIHKERTRFQPQCYVDGEVQNSLLWRPRERIPVETDRGTYWLAVAVEDRTE